MECRPHNESDAAIRDGLDRDFRNALTRRECTPSEKLEQLVSQFDSADSVDALRELENAIADISDALPKTSKALGLRLSGLILCELDDMNNGAALLTESIDLARQCRQPGEELASSRALLPVCWQMGRYDVIRELEARCEELAERMGFITVQWRAELEEPFEAQLERYGATGLVGRMLRMRRHAVDVGDVLGEAQATYRLACALWEKGRTEEARLELIRADLLQEYLARTHGA